MEDIEKYDIRQNLFIRRFKNRGTGLLLPCDSDLGAWLQTEKMVRYLSNQYLPNFSNNLIYSVAAENNLCSFIGIKNCKLKLLYFYFCLPYVERIQNKKLVTYHTA